MKLGPQESCTSQQLISTICNYMYISLFTINLWPHLDAVVLQWIYETFSNAILNNVIKRDSTAKTSMGGVV